MILVVVVSISVVASQRQLRAYSREKVIGLILVIVVVAVRVVAFEW